VSLRRAARPVRDRANPATIAFIGLGSNLGDPVQNVRSGIAAIAEIPKCDVVMVSSLYSSAPMGLPAQPDYVNAVAKLNTTLSSEALLDELLLIERQHGRVRTGIRWSPRTLDLDILIFGDEVRNDDRLTIPHPGISERAFVLYPLQELEPNVRIAGQPALAELIKRHPPGSVRRL